MQKRISEWLEKYFDTEEAVVLLLLLFSTALAFWLLGSILAPIFAALIIAFVLQGAVVFLEDMFADTRVPKAMGIYIVYVAFITLLGVVLILVLPLAWRQLASLVNYQLPLILAEGRSLVLMLPEEYPDVISHEQAVALVEFANGKLASLGETILSFSISNIPNVMALAVYLILVPLLVYFFLKDRQKLSDWVLEFLPNQRPRMTAIAQEMNAQISNYIRGKFIEIVIIGSVSYTCFAFFDLDYAALLGLLVGLSVIVPYVGAVAVTVPVMAISYLQFGYGGEDSHFVTIMVLYLFIQVLDGNVLVPILFSEAVNLHPVAIIVSILVFGGLWGFWGIFFAIPLATLVNALINSWPKRHPTETTELESS